jgi:hypothetical protein
MDIAEANLVIQRLERKLRYLRQSDPSDSVLDEEREVEHELHKLFE